MVSVVQPLAWASVQDRPLSDTYTRRMPGRDESVFVGGAVASAKQGEQVTVGPAVRGRNRFDPDRVTIEWRQR